jgi:hypothetical protein
MNVRAESGASAEFIGTGPGAAAILSAAIGCFALGAIAVIADKVQPVARLLNFYRPTGPLSGVTTAAILIWLVTWVALHMVWRRRDVALGRINAIAILLLIAGLLLTFPPVGDLL